MKVFRKRRRELFLESRAAWNASQSKSPAASANAERLIMPRKNRKVFQSLRSTVTASTGVMRPMISRSPAPAIAIMASFHLNGRTMMPIRVRIAMKNVRNVLVNIGR
jgi:hypothetical protein